MAFNKGKKKASGPGYDAMDALNLTLSFVTALSLSFVLSLHSTGVPGSLAKADFQGLLCTSHPFRLYVVEVMSEPEFNFSFKISLGELKSIDLLHELQVGIKKRHGDVTTGAERVACKGEYATNALVDALGDRFPMWRMRAWYTAMISTDAGANMRKLESWYVESMLSVSVAFFFLGLFWSILMHISLHVSGSKENAGALNAWLKVGATCTLIAYVLTIAALILYICALNMYIQYLSPMYASTRGNITLLSTWGILFPGVFVGVGLAIAAVVLSHLRADPDEEDTSTDLQNDTSRSAQQKVLYPACGKGVDASVECTIPGEVHHEGDDTAVEPSLVSPLKN